MTKYEIRNKIKKCQSCIITKASTLFNESNRLLEIGCKYEGSDIPEIGDIGLVEDMIAKDLIHVWHWLENLSDEVLKEG